MSKKNGGPAFPLCAPKDFLFIEDGISKLEYFAAKAMQAIAQSSWNSDASNIAEISYAIAQAMIEEGGRREQTKGD